MIWKRNSPILNNFSLYTVYWLLWNYFTYVFEVSTSLTVIIFSIYYFPINWLSLSCPISRYIKQLCYEIPLSYQYITFKWYRSDLLWNQYTLSICLLLWISISCCCIREHTVITFSLRIWASQKYRPTCSIVSLSCSLNSSITFDWSITFTCISPREIRDLQ